MEKRLILAVTFSILILLLWSAIMPKPPAPPMVEQPKLQPVVVPTEIQPEPPLASLLPFDQAKSEITFIEPQAAIQQVIFKAYNAHKFLLQHAFALLDKNLNFSKDKITPEELTFVHRDLSKQIIKQFIFHNSNYTIELEINVQNLSNSPLSVNYPISLGTLDFKTHPEAARFRDVAVATSSNGILHIRYFNGRKDAILEQPQFVALRDQYFCVIVEPLSQGHSLVIKRINPHATEISLILAETILGPKENLQEKFRIYLGPQDLRIIKNINPQWAGVVNYGFFDFISQLLLRLLEFFYGLVHNWGLAIIILSLAIYFLLYPLTIKQMRSMKEMQALQPRIEELRKMYKDNPQKLHKETLELYREHKVNPFGGCLPLLLQMPVFFALYQGLIRSIALKGASFLWIKDLSEPDRLFLLPTRLPVLNNEINILPILMAVIMFIQQKASLKTTSGEHAEQQKMMLIVMPVLFGLIFYHMPAGLVLYWFMNSLLTMINQLKMGSIPKAIRND
jgi:YidC/Oxa1 family membrane protein insertase